MKKFLTTVSLIIINSFILSQTISLAAQTTAQQTTISGLSTTATAYASQQLISSQNTVLALTASTTSTASTSLINAIKADSNQASNLNLVYGTSFKPTGPSTSYDWSTINTITSQSGYSQSAYLYSLTKTASLYRALQAFSYANREKFNAKYHAYLQATGSPMDADRAVLFQVIGTYGYDQAKFLSEFIGTTTPTTIPTTTPAPSSSGMFSGTSFWNAMLSSSTALNSNSANLVKELIAETNYAAPWINTDKYSTPFYIVDSTKTPKVSVSIVQNGKTMTYTKLNAESQKGVPIPTGAYPAAGTDGHMTIWDKATDKLYEYWQLKNVGGKWQASWGGIIEKVSTSSGIMPIVKNSMGGNEYWGATATGLPAIGGTILLAELKAGKIPHALAMAIPFMRNTFVAPAQRSDGYKSGSNYIPAGTQFKFPSSITINPSWSPLMKMMVRAIRDYGVVVRDTAGSVTFYGEDPKQYGSGDPYSAYYGGQPKWSVLNEFPWSQLQAIK